MRLFRSTAAWVCVLLLCAAVTTTHAEDEGGDTEVKLPFNSEHLLELKDGAAARKMLRDKSAVAVLAFYDPLDLNSVRLAPTIGKAATLLDGFAKVYAVNVREPSLQWIIDAWNVQVVPSIKGLPVRGLQRKQHEKSPLRHITSGIRRPVDFDEKDNMPETIKRWALQMLTKDNIERVADNKLLEDMKKLTEQSLEDEGNTHPLVVLFTDKEATSQLYKALSQTFVGRARFVEVYSKTAKKICDHYRVERYPTLLLFSSKKDPSKRIHGPVNYEGKLNIQEITEFINPYTVSEAKIEAHFQKQAKKILKKEKSLAANPVEPVATVEEWFNVLQRQKISGILFVDGSSADKRDKDISVLGEFVKSPKGKKATKGMKFFWVDKTKNEELVRFFFQEQAVEDAPNLVFLNTKKKAMTKFLGAFSHDSLLEFVQGKLAAGTGAKPLAVEEIPVFQDAVVAGGSDE